MGVFIDLTGKKFGRLTVKYKFDEKINNQIVWVCDCDCGTKDVKVIGRNLRDGCTKSCGCLHDERIVQYNVSA